MDSIEIITTEVQEVQDVQDVKSVLENAVHAQLEDSKDVKHSLQIQNHIYGCFIIMEDIAQKLYEVSGTILSGTNFTFDMDTQFSEIGIRFGFIMDTKLDLDSFLPEYKTAWLKRFDNTDLDEVDATEDIISDTITKLVPAENAFFLHALDKGTLPQEWVGKILDILSEKKSAITNAIIEKNIKKVKKLTTKKHVKFDLPKKFALTRKVTHTESV